ncbi:hypothetical protein CC2G_003029 [Coprinopsis cinerea AmutBmut pab1-1]|nr:hypothetical protein CC2G_003029 [Coprinopsis cinerea AmutBmut pab1-1]
MELEKVGFVLHTRFDDMHYTVQKLHRRTFKASENWTTDKRPETLRLTADFDSSCWLSRLTRNLRPSHSIYHVKGNVYVISMVPLQRSSNHHGADTTLPRHIPSARYPKRNGIMMHVTRKPLRRLPIYSFPVLEIRMGRKMFSKGLPHTLLFVDA